MYENKKGREELSERKGREKEGERRERKKNTEAYKERENIDCLIHLWRSKSIQYALGTDMG